MSEIERRQRVPIKGAYYRLKSGHGSLCFRVLKCNYVNYDKKYFKIKIDWWSIASGGYWGNIYGLPRNWKLSFENFESFERFQTKWSLPHG